MSYFGQKTTIANVVIFLRKILTKDAKTALQEFVQNNHTGELPVYEYLPQTGPSHNPVFNASVTALGKTATGAGSSKKEASTAAAAELLKILAI